MTQMILNGVVVALLIYVVIVDLRTYRIRNAAVLALLVLTLAHLALGASLARLLAHGLFAAVMFGLAFAAYARGLVGGGDAKLMAVAFLWTGPHLALVFSVALFALSLLYWAGLGLGLLPSQRVDGRTKAPFGPSLAGAWIVTILASGAA